MSGTRLFPLTLSPKATRLGERLSKPVLSEVEGGERRHNLPLMLRQAQHERIEA